MLDSNLKRQEEELAKWNDDHFGMEKFKKNNHSLKKFLKPIIAEIKKRKIKVITVGGTNGKGQTVLTLSYLFQHFSWIEKGISAKVPSFSSWMSPHVVTLRERIRLQGELISYEEITELRDKLMEEMKKSGEKLSYFEFYFLIYLRFSLKYQVDFLIMEVGLGGRLDASNLIDAHVTAITSISRDHEKILGIGYKKILHEKLGITRTGVPLFTAFELQYCQKWTELHCQKNGIEWHDLFLEKKIRKKDSFKKRNAFLGAEIFQDILKRFYGQEVLSTCAVGELQDLALHMKDLFAFGRGEKVQLDNVRFSFWGGHNSDGIKKLHDYLCTEQKHFDGVLVSFSEKNEEDIILLTKLLKNFKSIADQVFLTTFDHERASQKITDIWPKISGYFVEQDIHLLSHWEKALHSFQQQTKMPKDILVFGSYYFVSQVYHKLDTLSS